MRDVTIYFLEWLALCLAGGGVCFLLAGRVAYALGADGTRAFTWSKPFTEQTPW